jgi:hypothetical protein
MADELISRAEALGGLPAGRARTLLFLIESRTGQFEARSRLAEEELPTEQAAEERDLAFLEAFASGREPPLRPTIQDLERYAPRWAHLVPENVRVRAAVGHLLGQKYKFTYQTVPGIRGALGLDQKPVQEAYQRLYSRPLQVIFAPRATPAERLRWASTAVSKWLNALPPFWTTFVLVLTLSLPQSVLAVPIATAGLGPTAGIALLMFFGVFNVLTMACMAEAFGRNGSIRYGKAFTGRVVADYVGGAGSLFLTSATAMRLFIGLVACYYGLSVTIAGLTSIPAGVWSAFLFLVAVYLVAGRSLNFSTALSALFGAVSISLVLMISLAALRHVHWANLAYVNLPSLGPHPFQRGISQAIFGIVIQCYIAHTYLTQCAKVVLPRDPGAGTLMRGTVAASVALTVLLSGWILVVNGVVAPSMLSGQSGTALPLLTRQIGPFAIILGFLLVLLLLGLGFIRQSTVLFNLVSERIPTRLGWIVVLPRRRASLLFEKRGTQRDGPRLALTYLGLSSGQAQFRLDGQFDGNVHRMEMKFDKHWDISALLERIPELRSHGLGLALEIVEADPDKARLRVTSTMNLKYVGDWCAPGLHIADVSTLRDPLRQLINWTTRQGEVSLAEVMAHTVADEKMARTMVEELIGLGFVHRVRGVDPPRYRTRLAARHGRQVPKKIWQSLDGTVAEPQRPRRISPKQGPHPVLVWFRTMLLSRGGRFSLSMSPIVLVFLVTEWLVLTGISSFTAVLAVGGLLANSLVSGIFPVLLLVSSRRKGDLVPSVVIRLLGHPFVVIGIYLVFLIILFLHATVIWSNPVARAAASFVGLLVLTATAAMVRQGAFSRRLIVELREDTRPGDKARAVFTITADGQPVAGEGQMKYADGEQRQYTAGSEVAAFSSLRSAAFRLPATQAKELKVWAHRITPDGDSEGLPGLLEVHLANKTRRFDLKLSGGQVVLPLTGAECWLEITFDALSTGIEAKW